MSIKLKLINNDSMICAETDLALEKEESKFDKFLKEINEELVVGNTAYLEIEGSRFEISKAE
jgi:hypothetical protein